DRETKAGAFAGRFGGEKWREHLRLDVRWDTDAVVTDARLDLIAEVARRYPQRGPVARTDVAVLLTFLRSIKAVAEQIEKHARDVLGNQLERTQIGVEIALERDVEILVLRAGTMIGEVE